MSFGSCTSGCVTDLSYLCLQFCNVQLIRAGYHCRHCSCMPHLLCMLAPQPDKPMCCTQCNCLPVIIFPAACSGTFAYRIGRQGAVLAAASSSAEDSCPSGSHEQEVQAFREHADSTNDIFLVAAQAVANTLLRARAALSGQSAHLVSADLMSADLCMVSPFMI